VGLIDQVAARFQEEITSGRWPVGERIPVEADLVTAFGAGRNTVREALQSLVHAGLLSREQGRGTFVISTFVASSGTPVRQFARGVDFLETYSANGRAISSVTPATIHLDVATNTLIGTGNQRHFIVPGAGVVYAQAGRFVIDLGTGTTTSAVRPSTSTSSTTRTSRSPSLRLSAAPRDQPGRCLLREAERLAMRAETSRSERERRAQSALSGD